MVDKRISELDPAGPLTGNELVELVQPTGSELGNVRSPLAAIVEQLALQGPPGPAGSQGAPGPAGADGLSGADGADGNNGWSPIFAVVTDGARCVLQVVGWAGGTGTAPTTGQFIGTAGLVDNIADAVDVRGVQGEQGQQGPAGVDGANGADGVVGADGQDGWSPVFSVVVDGSRDVLRVTDWVGGTGSKPASGQYVGATGFVDAIADGVDIRGPAGAAGPAGPAGNDGPAGASGPAGADGAGVPAGGTTGQILAKTSNADLDTHWIDPPQGGGNAARTINTQSASYTLQLSDAGGIVEMNVASANNLTVPDNATVAFPVGTQIDIAQYGAGQTTMVQGADVTINSVNGNKKLYSRYSTATLYKRATNEWMLTGDLVA